MAKRTIAKEVQISHPGLLVSVLQLVFHSPGAGILNLLVLVCRTFKEQDRGSLSQQAGSCSLSQRSWVCVLSGRFGWELLSRNSEQNVESNG